MNTAYGAKGADRLNTSRLTVGQQLVLLNTQSSRWGDTTREVRQSILTITKILKTRLVAQDETGREYRFIVEYSKTYTYRNGDVTTDLEGSRGDRFAGSSGWYKTLWTTDDPELVAYLGRIDEVNAQIIAKREARAALETFKASISVENAEAAIAALQTYVASQKA